MATILFLAHRIPYPPNKGDKLRAYQVLNHWTKQHKVLLGCFVDDPEDMQHTDLLRERCAGTYFARLHPRIALMRASHAFLTSDPLSLPYYRDQGLARWVRSVAASEKPNCAFVYSSVMAQYLPDAVPPPPRVVVDFVDVDSEKWAEYAARKTFPARHVYRREARQLLRFDRGVARQAHASIFVSEPEAELFRRLAPEVQEKVIAIPNGIDATYFSPENAGTRPDFGGTPVIVFTGRMDYWPNVDAVIWFSDAVLPKLREKFPQSIFCIVGAKPTAAVEALSLRSGIIVTGAVPDTRPYLGHADVVVAPMRIGRGIQNKVLEGMAMARPVIATPQALEGIDASPGKHLLLAEDSDGFLSGIEKLMNPAFSKGIGAAARQRVLEAYKWANSFEKYDQALKSNR
jgi:sugar transferase (PEP-CTERM/EpsH1 system associated)